MGCYRLGVRLPPVAGRLLPRGGGGCFRRGGGRYRWRGGEACCCCGVGAATGRGCGCLGGAAPATGAGRQQLPLWGWRLQLGWGGGLPPSGSRCCPRGGDGCPHTCNDSNTPSRSCCCGCCVLLLRFKALCLCLAGGIPISPAEGKRVGLLGVSGAAGPPVRPTGTRGEARRQDRTGRRRSARSFALAPDPPRVRGHTDAVVWPRVADLRSGSRLASSRPFGTYFAAPPSGISVWGHPPPTSTAGVMPSTRSGRSSARGATASCGPVAAPEPGSRQGSEVVAAAAAALAASAASSASSSSASPTSASSSSSSSAVATATPGAADVAVPAGAGAASAAPTGSSAAPPDEVVAVDTPLAPPGRAAFRCRGAATTTPPATPRKKNKRAALAPGAALTTPDPLRGFTPETLAALARAFAQPVAPAAVAGPPAPSQGTPPAASAAVDVGDDDDWVPEPAQPSRARSRSGRFPPGGADDGGGFVASGAGRGGPRAAFSRAAVDAVYDGCPRIQGLELPSRLAREGVFPEPFKPSGDPDFSAEFGSGRRNAKEATVLYMACAWLQNLTNAIADYKSAASTATPTLSASLDVTASARTHVYQIYSLLATR
ncbi:hypothetical protein I4F81_001957 [Pyropia yezoensis]|uniref:Uncharacterized protein n=1 Tax=Pyropia yezoensis TaxID=2788 RepID=A0ACC3BN63_PYRYE|nr:hypothetical protein I4F81_001957 [Neopyropia yezoensis]